jgi:proteic killer suppression protein
MIVSFAEKITRKIWDGEIILGLPIDIQEIARRKLRMINGAQDLNDLRIPPANRLKKLRGELKDYYSIRINSQWRIIFKWINGHAENVKIIDYH